jgi:predicted small metal-binding protein
MKEFKCSSLGYNDGWKYAANTDDLLLDTVALHLHSPADAAAVADLIMKEYNCDRDPACTWRYFAQNEDVIVAGARAHAREVHGVGEFTETMTKKVKKNIRPFKGKQKAA